MKFPSAQTLLQATLSTIKRFPLVILFAALGCFYGLRINHLRYDNEGAHYYYTNIIWSAYLGMLLALIVAVYAERKYLSSKLKWLGGIITIALAGAYYFSLPDHFVELYLKQFTLFMIGLHLLVAFIPFTAKGEVNGFWQYNKTLFLRFLSAALYSSVLFMGLALAILAIEKLFSINIQDKWYLDLWICIFGGFSSIFFLAGFPSAFEKLEANTDYPKGLKIFTQYVLIPLISVYLIILYAYTFKIIETRQWPYGWVSYLVLAFAIAGILSLLLIHPVREQAQNKWMMAFSRFFYFAICPMIILLFLAIERRINEYGITEGRYFVLGLSCWLALIAVYFIVSKKKNIKFIPITLCILAFGVSFGPWGAFSVSLKSQTRRLKQFLQANNMLSDNQKLIPAKAYLHAGDASQIRSIVNYIVEVHGYPSLQPLFLQNLDSMLKEEKGRGYYYSYSQSEKLLAYMKIDKYESTQTVEKSNYFRIAAEKDDSLRMISGYEYLVSGYNIQNNDIPADSIKNIYKQANHSVQVIFIRNSGKLYIGDLAADPIIFDISGLVKTLKKNDYYDDNNNFSQESMTLGGENKSYSVKCILRDIFSMANNEKVEIREINADLLIHFKNSEAANHK